MYMCAYACANSHYLLTKAELVEATGLRVFAGMLWNAAACP
jgi:hypothetical protein